MKLYKVDLRLDKDGWKPTVETLEVEEKAKTYSNKYQRIAKDKIMQPDTIFRDTWRFFRYFTYCLDGQQQEAITMLKSHILSKISKVQTELSEVLVHLNSAE